MRYLCYAREGLDSHKTVFAKEPGWSRAESKTGIRAADMTHERPGQDQAPSNQRNRQAAEARRGQTLRVTTLILSLATRDSNRLTPTSLAPTSFLSNLRLQLTRPTHTEFSLYPLRMVS